MAKTTGFGSRGLEAIRRERKGGELGTQGGTRRTKYLRFNIKMLGQLLTLVALGGQICPPEGFSAVTFFWITFLLHNQP